MRLPEVYVKGNNVRAPGSQFLPHVFRTLILTHICAQIKYLRVPDEIIDIVSEQQKGQQSNFRGGRGGQSRGDHSGRGGDNRGRGRGGGGGGRGRGRGGRGQQ